MEFARAGDYAWPMRAAAFGFVIAFLAVACAAVAPPTATPKIAATPDPVVLARAVAAAEAEMRIRAWLPRDLPPGAFIARVARANDQPPTLDIEYLFGERHLLLRQRPALAEPGFPAGAEQVDLDGVPAWALVRVDASGNPVQSELYWVRGGMDFALAGHMPIEDLMRVARGVAPPSAA